MRFSPARQRRAQGRRRERELDQSLRRLRTDHFDLYQFHAVSSMADVEQILGPGGAAEVFVKARKEGEARYLGFSAHNAEAAIALMDRMPLDSILFPVNYVNYQQGKFGEQILAHAKQKGLARLALKAMAYRPWPAGLAREQRDYPKCWYQPLSERDMARDGIRFTLSQDVTAAIPPGDERLFEMAVELAQAFKPLSVDETNRILASSQGVEPIFKA
ncbi:MAG: aldo/keto reductase [Bryobacterales bacterium]|nr:aldo/keto reductase [Bryobacterales bacterium]